jgi:hypothetical protein
MQDKGKVSTNSVTQEDQIAISSQVHENVMNKMRFRVHRADPLKIGIEVDQHHSQSLDLVQI